MSISKKTVRDINLTDKRVLLRVDFNVPMKDGAVQDDTRIRASLPTITYILEQKPKYLILMSHLGDPKKDMQKAKEKAEKEGKQFDEKKYLEGKHMMAPVAKHLETLLGKTVKFAPACFGPEVDAIVHSLKQGEILMLENTRFHKEETSKDAQEREKMAKALAAYADVYVNDAFGTAHRAHASTETIAKFLPAVAGFLMEKELEYLEDKIIKSPEKPFVALVGGAKVSSKIAVLESLLSKVNSLIIGGGMAYTFLKAKGTPVGNSLVEDDMLNTAREILAKAVEKGVKILLPIDHVEAKEFSANAESKVTETESIDEGWIGMDIGPKTLSLFKNELTGAKTVFWNGPMGVFEFPPFAVGTEQIARMLADLPAITVIGGGDSVSAVNKAGVAHKMSHISTGGGASLELVEGKTLPGVAALNDR
ncbi:MAG: phosphoglycerate kinase [Spirochaetes bacterium]|nr:phosphoglycerate kinase [Spirochaetota bacterium]